MTPAFSISSDRHHAKKTNFLGVGGIGIVLGLICDNDPTCRVVLLERGPHIQTIRDTGCVQFQRPSPTREAQVIGTNNPADIAGSDIVLVTVKPQATAEAIAAPYNKLAINSPGYAASLSQSNFITEAVCHRGWRTAVGKPLADECLRVFDTAGVKLARIPKLPDIRKLRGFFGKLDSPLLGPIVGTGAKLIFNRRPIQFSLYQDLLKGKGTEVDHTLGEIVRLAERNGTTAPYNQMVIDLAREIENRGAGKFFTREEVIDRFRQIESR